MKKIICIIFAFTLLISTNAHAAIDVVQEEKNITVTAQIDSNASAVMIVVMDGHTAEEANYVVAMKKATADETGLVKFEFAMPEEKLWDNTTDVTGQYNVYAKQNGKTMLEGSFYYANETRRDDLQTALDGCGTSAASFEAVLENPIYVDALRAEGFGIDLYNNLSTEELKDGVVAQVMSKLTSLTGKTNSEIAAAMKEAVVLAVLNDGMSTPAKVKSALEEANLTFDNESYNAQGDAKATWIASAMLTNKPYANTEALVSAYEKVNSLYVLNNADFSDLTELLSKYEDELGIKNDSDYLEYKENESKTSINIALESELRENQPDTTEELIAAIVASLPTNSDDSDSGNGGGTSSGPGGGTGGSPATNMVPVGTLPATQKFSDIGEAKWAETAINAMVNAGIVVGDGTGKFRPNDPVTREEFVKMVVLAAGLYDMNATSNFADVPSNAWYASYVASAVNNGIIFGISDTKFGSGQTLTRQDMSVICFRTLAKIKGIQKIREDVVFADEEMIADYASEAIHKLYAAGLINGVGANLFDPCGTATRAQTAQILYNIFLM